MDAPGLACERAFLDDECEADAALEPEHPVTYESLRPIEELPVLAFSVAYELEICRPRPDAQRGPHSGAAPRPRRAPPARHRRRPAHVLQPDAARRDRRRHRRRRGRRARRDGGARGRRAAGRATRSSTRLAAIPHVFVPARHKDLPPGRRGGRRDPPGALGDPHAEHRARRTCSSSRPSAGARAAAATA